MGRDQRRPCPRRPADRRRGPGRCAAAASDRRSCGPAAQSVGGGAAIVDAGADHDRRARRAGRPDRGDAARAGSGDQRRARRSPTASSVCFRRSERSCCSRSRWCLSCRSSWPRSPDRPSSRPCSPAERPTRPSPGHPDLRPRRARGLGSLPDDSAGGHGRGRRPAAHHPPQLGADRGELLAAAGLPGCWSGWSPSWSC